MGVAVFSGMLGVTLFGLLLTPIFYWTVRRLTRARAARREAAPRLKAAE
jgi:multidrug efflux pump